MPIIDYKDKAQKEKKHFQQLKIISKKNKEIIEEFLIEYETSRSPARVTLFLRHIRKFLEKTPDIMALIYSAEDKSTEELEKVKQVRSKVNKIFNELRNEIGINYYATVVNVTLMLVRHLHNDEMPDSFRHVKRVPQKKQQRKLRSTDMWTWEDGVKAINTVRNLQSQAILMTQLDAGMRPSEFLDLNYGDVTIMKDVVAIEDKATKNDKEDSVILFRSVPYFMKWYNSHPTKDPNDPLWLLNNSKSHRKNENAKESKTPSIKRLSYAALNKQIKLMSEKAEISKPHDMYNLRHSSCWQDKMENLPVELAAKKHRHSTEFFVETYGRLDVTDIADRYRQHHGIGKEKKSLPKNQICSMCNYVNEPEMENCYQCNRPLTLKKALENHEEVESLRNELEAMKIFMLKSKDFREYVEERKVKAR